MAKGVTGDLPKRLVAQERRLCALSNRLGDHHMAERQSGFSIFYSQHYHHGRGVPRRVVVETPMAEYAT